MNQTQSFVKVLSWFQRTLKVPNQTWHYSWPLQNSHKPWLNPNSSPKKKSVANSSAWEDDLNQLIVHLTKMKENLFIISNFDITCETILLQSPSRVLRFFRKLTTRVRRHQKTAWEKRSETIAGGGVCLSFHFFIMMLFDFIFYDCHGRRPPVSQSVNHSLHYSLTRLNFFTSVASWMLFMFINPI